MINKINNICDMQWSIYVDANIKTMGLACKN